LPIERALASHQPPIDSRSLFGLWATQHLPTPCALIVPSVFPLSPEALPPGLTVESIDLSNVTATRAAARPGRYMLLPDWNRSKKSSIQRIGSIQAGLDALPPSEPIIHFDGKAVIPLREVEIFNNPAFAIVRFP
jgi:hypothetical protein